MLYKRYSPRGMPDLFRLLDIEPMKPYFQHLLVFQKPYTESSAHSDKIDEVRSIISPFRNVANPSKE